MHIFTDGLSKVTLSNLNLRVTLVQNGPDNKQVEAGTLIIPATMASTFVNSLANSLGITKILKYHIRNNDNVI